MRSRPSFTRFLARSLALLEDELPEAYASVAHHLAGLEVRLEVDGEALSVRARAGRLHLALRAQSPAVELGTTRTVIGSLIDGEFSLLEAILSERVGLRGAVEDLIRFDAGLLAYLNGAVRCPAFPELRDEYLGGPEPTHLTEPSRAPGVHDA